MKTVYLVQDLSLEIHGVFSSREEALKYAQIIEEEINKDYYSWLPTNEFDCRPYFNSVTVVKYPIYKSTKDGLK